MFAEKKAQTHNPCNLKFRWRVISLKVYKTTRIYSDRHPTLNDTSGSAPSIYGSMFEGIWNGRKIDENHTQTF